MKKILCVFLCMGILLCNAQQKRGLHARIFLKKVNSEKSLVKLPEDFVKKYPISYLKDTTYIRIIAKVSKDFAKEAFSCKGIRIHSMINQIVSMQVPINMLSVLDMSPEILQYDIARKIVPLCNNARFDTKVDSIQAGFDLPSSYTGDGVLIGIMDWGFDYTHPNFYNSTYKYSRIYKAWDQFKVSGPSPNGFDYGTEFDNAVAIKNAKGDTSGLYGYGTHGTHVAGIAGGNGFGTIYKGMAPDAEFLFASFLLDESSGLDAITWMKNQADNAGKRLVINMSWGMYSMGSMDGNSLLSQAIDAYSEQGVVFVSSAGNNGDVPFHISKTFNETPDTLKTTALFHSSGVGQSIAFWGEPNTGFEAGLGIATSDSLYRSPLYSTTDSRIAIDTFLYVGTDTISYSIIKESTDIYSNRPHFVLTLKKINPNYKLHIFATTTHSTLHGWNVVELENHAGNWGTSFSANGLRGYQGGDFYYGIGEPSCAKSCISVAAHVPDKPNSEGNITSFSSYGPIMNNSYTKPDISAPGQNICSSLSSFTTEPYDIVQSVFFNGKRYSFVKMSGTSMSSPVVTGIVALLLQANPKLTPSQIKDIITETARTDSRTGDLTDSISVRWGHGKVNAYLAIKKALENVSIKPIISTESLIIYPNPAKDHIYLERKNGHPSNIDIYTLEGKRILEIHNTTQSYVDLSNINSGIYILKVKTLDHTSTHKLLIIK